MFSQEQCKPSQHVNKRLDVFINEDCPIFQKEIESGEVELDLMTSDVKLKLGYFKNMEKLRVIVTENDETNTSNTDDQPLKLQFTAQQEIRLKLLLKSIKVRTIQPIIPKSSQSIDLKHKLNIFLNMIGVHQSGDIIILTKPIQQECYNVDVDSQQNYHQYVLQYQFSQVTIVAFGKIAENINFSLNEGPNIDKYIEKLYESWKPLQNLRRMFPVDDNIKEIEQKLLNNFPIRLPLNNKQIFIQTVQHLYYYLNKKDSISSIQTLFDILPRQQTDEIINQVDKKLKKLIKLAKKYMNQIKSNKENSNQYILKALTIIRACEVKKILQNMADTRSLQNYQTIINLLSEDQQIRQQQLKEIHQKAMLQHLLQNEDSQNEFIPEFEDSPSVRQWKEEHQIGLRQQEQYNLQCKVNFQQIPEQHKDPIGNRKDRSKSYGNYDCQDDRQLISNQKIAEVREGQLNIRIGTNIDKFPIRKFMQLIKQMIKYQGDGLINQQLEFEEIKLLIQNAY